MRCRHSREGGNPVFKHAFKKWFTAWIPAFAGMTVFFATPTFAAEKISFRTTDGVTLNTVLSKPSPGKPTIIMLHGLASNKEEWQPLIDVLKKRGVGVLAYDMRPAGTPWPKLVDDVGAAVRFLESNGVDRKSVVLAGASLGANVCLKYAALTGTGRAIVLLSPGLNYQGLSIEDAVAKVKTMPLLFVASPADGYAFKSCRQLMASAGNGEFWSSQKPGHGVQMFDVDLLGRLAQWIEKTK